MSDVSLTWNLVDDVAAAARLPFMLNALRAGTIVAVVAGAIGWFMVLRRQAFAGHTLAVIGFPGAAGAIWLGVNAAFGYFGFCIAAALVIAALPAALRASRGGAGEESAVIGTVQAFALACGFLFVSLYKGFLGGLNGLLFGTPGVTDVPGRDPAGRRCGRRLAVLAVIGRPLLFASVDPDVARRAAFRCALLSARHSWCCSAVAAAGPARSPAACWCSRLLVRPRRRPRAGSPRGPRSALDAVGRDRGARSPGSASASRSSPPYPIGFWVTSLGVRRIPARQRVPRRRGSARPVRRPSGPTGAGVGRRRHELADCARIAGIAHMLAHPFIQHAFAGRHRDRAAVGLVGYFVVLRGQVFAGDALSHVAYTGALAALAAGVDLRLGLFAATIAVGLVLGLLGGRGTADDVVIGSTFAWVLGLGVLLPGDVHHPRAAPATARRASACCSARSSASAQTPRPTAAVDRGGRDRRACWRSPGRCCSPASTRRSRRPRRAGAAARAGFLAIVGASAAEATQAVGALLLFGLLAAPAAAAHRLTDRPWRALVLSAAARRRRRCGRACAWPTPHPGCRRVSRSWPWRRGSTRWQR